MKAFIEKDNLDNPNSLVLKPETSLENQDLIKIAKAKIVKVNCNNTVSTLDDTGIYSVEIQIIIKKAY